MIVGMLDMLERGRDEQSAAQTRLRHAAERRQTIQRQCSLAASRERDMIDSADKARVRGGAIPAGAGRCSWDRRSRSRSVRDALAGLQYHSAGAISLGPECLPPRRRCEWSPGCSRRPGKRIAQSAHPALGLRQATRARAHCPPNRYNKVSTVPGGARTEVRASTASKPSAP